VFGVADERWGQIVAATIKSDARLDSEELDRFCTPSGLARYKRPRKYFFVDAIPKSPVGKILRRKLRDSLRVAD
jgi:2-furoate---CoA ligase